MDGWMDGYSNTFIFRGSNYVVVNMAVSRPMSSQNPNTTYFYYFDPYPHSPGGNIRPSRELLS